MSKPIVDDEVLNLWKGVQSIQQNNSTEICMLGNYILKTINE